MKKPRTENQLIQINSTLMFEISKMEPTNTILNKMYFSSRSFSFCVQDKGEAHSSRADPEDKTHLPFGLPKLSEDEVLCELAKAEQEHVGQICQHLQAAFWRGATEGQPRFEKINTTAVEIKKKKRDTTLPQPPRQVHKVSQSSCLWKMDEMVTYKHRRFGRNQISHGLGNISRVGHGPPYAQACQHRGQACIRT